MEGREDLGMWERISCRSSKGREVIVLGVGGVVGVVRERERWLCMLNDEEGW